MEDLGVRNDYYRNYNIYYIVYGQCLHSKNTSHIGSRLTDTTCQDDVS